jgi:hypothetical protein
LTVSEHVHVRANALTALASMDRWEALIAGVRSAGDSEPRVIQAAQRILVRWMSVPAALYTRPSEDQRLRIRSALASAPDLADVKRTLNTILGSA